MMQEVELRDVEAEDLAIFFEQQLDAEATRMAGFPSRDRASFDAHWGKNILGNEDAMTRTIVAGGEVAGYVGSWLQDGVRLVGYWLGREYWGKGIATRALSAFLEVVAGRPMHAHVVPHNAASIRVLEKCGFRLEQFASDDEESAELVFVLR